MRTLRIPRDSKTDQGLRTFCLNYLDVLDQNAAAFALNPTDLAGLRTLLTDYSTKLEKALSPDGGTAATFAKNTAKKTLEDAVNEYSASKLESNTAVTGEVVLRLGFHLRDTTPTVHPAPYVQPTTEALPVGRGLHSVTAINPQEGSKKKPPHVIGVAFASKLRNASDPVSLAEDMPSETQTSVTRKCQWSQSDYGKIADYATAYLGSGGKRGPWSLVESVIVG